MKIRNSVGSKERLFEMFQNVNKIKLNENLNSGLESNQILESTYSKLKNNELQITNSKTHVDDEETHITLHCKGQGNMSCEFVFGVVYGESSQEGVYNVENVRLTSFEFSSDELSFEMDGDMLDEFNSKYGDELFNVIEDYVDVDDDTPELDSLYEELGKKIDSYPFGNHPEEMQKSVNYGDKKPVNTKLRVDNSKPNKYVPVINEIADADTIIDKFIYKSFDTLSPLNKSNIIKAAKMGTDEYIKKEMIAVQPEEYLNLLKDVANSLYVRMLTVMNETTEEETGEPTPNEVGGNVQTQLDVNNDVEPKLPTRFGEEDNDDGEALEGGLGDGKQPIEFDNQQVLRGIEVEMEHTNDPRIALEIALDHLTEDSEYYTKHDECHGEESELNPEDKLYNEDDYLKDKLLGYEPKNIGDINEFDYAASEVEYDNKERLRKYLEYTKKDFNSLGEDEKDEYFELWKEFRGAEK